MHQTCAPVCIKRYYNVSSGVPKVSINDLRKLLAQEVYYDVSLKTGRSPDQELLKANLRTLMRWATSSWINEGLDTYDDEKYPRDEIGSAGTSLPSALLLALAILYLLLEPLTPYSALIEIL
ncbi:hypothetical protein OESDEN_05501 [Oesophagostomum dentatum]|uniref:Uncharacterized protein n=1 Tax=Oesophagostomum dentatum TaxID=61180 RepID=A0A0B1TBC4_OESDE|nr:hypothetical protein OESDEN_05501 [Oesophagostomum dentatum]